MSRVLLRAQGVQFGFSQPLFSGVSFQLEAGTWTGVSGVNGAGKTTLLRLLAGELRPDTGSIATHGRIELVTHGEIGDTHSDPRGIGDTHSDPGRSDGSPGELKQRQLAAALRSGASVLLLDEPTSHLDAQARQWVLRMLRRFDGAGLVVSHDRALLDALTSSTMRLAQGTARLYPGPYSQARLLWEAEERERRDARDAASARERVLRRRLADARRDREGAAAQRSTGRRMRSRHDSDARGLGADFRVEQAEKRMGRNVEVLRRAHERAADEAEALAVERERGRPVYLGYQRCPRPILARGDSWSVPREARIWISGRNGAGKSTLLRQIHAAMPAEQVLYLPQELSAGEARQRLDQVRALAPEERGRVLTLVAALGADPGRLLASAQPSSGEARKLLIALGLGRHAWALLLDEPESHLDLRSIERLEAALRDYPGALLLATHDQRLAEACCTDRWPL